jgi:hypothetical protein
MAQLTTDKSASPLWVAPLGHVNFETLEMYARDGYEKQQPAVANNSKTTADLSDEDDDEGQSEESAPSSSSSLSSSSSSAKSRQWMWDTVVGVRPTGWTHQQKGSSSSSSVLTVRERQRYGGPGGGGGPRLIILGAPYSEHSSFPELFDCVASLAPRRIVPTVNCNTEAAVKAQLDLLLPRRGSERLLV